MKTDQDFQIYGYIKRSLFIHYLNSDLDLTSGYISTVNWNLQIYLTMDLPVELVGLLKHAGINGKKLTWDLQVNSSAISVKLMWIKAGKPVEKTGKVTSQAQKKKHLSPSTRKRNALRISQRKAKRYEAVEDIKTCAETQTDDSIPITDESTQTEIHNDERALHNPTTSTQVRERSTQTIRNFIGRQLTPTTYLIDPEEVRKPWKTCTTVRSRTSEKNLHTKRNLKTDRCHFQNHSTRTTQR